MLLVEAATVVVCVVIMCMRLMGKDMPNHIVLKADAQGRWGADDILGIERAANVERSFFKPENDNKLLGPSVISETKGFFYP